MENSKVFINNLKSARLRLIKAVDSFPEEKREIILFGNWSLKDVLSHLIGWDIFTVSKIKEFLGGKEPKWEESIDDFNRKNVERRKNLSWDEIYREFIKYSRLNIQSYEEIPVDKYDSKIWKDRRFTPKEFMRIDIDHYEKEHLPEILKFSK